MSGENINEVFGIAEEEQHKAEVCHAGISATTTISESEDSNGDVCLEHGRKKTNSNIIIPVLIGALVSLLFAIARGNDIIDLFHGWSAGSISIAIAIITLLGILLVRQIFRLIVWILDETDAFEFSGRARRSTYWTMVVVSSVLIGVLCGIAAGVSGNAFEYGVEEGIKALGGVAVLLILLALPLLIWAWAVQVRRCHDLGWSGWAVIGVWLVGFIPVVGWIASLIFTVFLGFVDGQPFMNQYGPDPKGRNFSPAVNNPQALPKTAAPAIPAFAQKSFAEQLRELKQLFDEGILTQEEFAAQKAKVLDGKSVVADATRTDIAKESQTEGAEAAPFSIKIDSSNILGDSAPQMVTIRGKGFSISKYPVTQELWEKVMGVNPSALKETKHPVENVSWDDCQKFLEKLNALSWGSGQIYRLPTEEEWKYACRAGAKGDYCRLEDGTEITPKTLEEIAWFDKNSGGQTHPVGQKKPNAFGLYDMLGNVWEWTSTQRAFGRVNCGGGYGTSKYNFAVGLSDTSDPDTRDNAIGFRLARDI